MDPTPNRKPINTSKSHLGLCKNDKCKNKRRHCSAYCQECSDKSK